MWLGAGCGRGGVCVRLGVWWGMRGWGRCVVEGMCGRGDVCGGGVW